MGILKTAAIAVLVVILILAAIIVISHPTISPTKNPPKTQPQLVFLPPAMLYLMFDENFHVANYSANLSTSFSKLYKYGIVEAFANIYNTSSNASHPGMLAIFMAKFNSSLGVSEAMSNLSVLNLPSLIFISNGTYNNFTYSSYRINQSAIQNATAILAHEGPFLLIMYFLGSTASRMMTIFDEQIDFMLPASPELPSALPPQLFPSLMIPLLALKFW